jgi:hypothetical protein
VALGVRLWVLEEVVARLISRWFWLRLWPRMGGMSLDDVSSGEAAGAEG